MILIHLENEWVEEWNNGLMEYWKTRIHTGKKNINKITMSFSEEPLFFM